MTSPMLREDVLDHGYVELVDIMPDRVPCSGPNCHSGVIHAQGGTGSVINTGIPCPTCGGNGELPRDIAIVNAARTSYLGESKGLEADKKLLRYLYENHHTAPFEMVELQFKVKAPVLVWWQWMNHHIWDYSLQSDSHTEHPDEFYFPEKWRLQDQKNEQGNGGRRSQR